MVKKILLIIAVVIFSLMIFAPKRELYYLLEEQLLKYDVVISNEDIDEGLFLLHIKHPDIYVKGIELAKIEKIDIIPLLLYSRVVAKGITTDRSLKKLMPVKVTTLKIVYQILNPKRVSISVVGDFGKADGYLYIDEGRVRLYISEPADIAKLKRLLRKDDKGWYYETTL